MSIAETTLSVRIPSELNDRLGEIAKSLHLKKIDYIRFVLEASTHIDDKELKQGMQALYRESVSNGIRFTTKGNPSGGGREQNGKDSPQ